jgi:hypothetical protein
MDDEFDMFLADVQSDGEAAEVEPPQKLYKSEHSDASRVQAPPPVVRPTVPTPPPPATAPRPGPSPPPPPAPLRQQTVATVQPVPPAHTAKIAPAATRLPEVLAPTAASVRVLSMGEEMPSRFCIFVGNLPASATAPDIQTLFAKYKSLNGVLVGTKGTSAQCLGYAFASFEDGREMLAALKEADGKFVDGKPCQLKQRKLVPKR